MKLPRATLERLTGSYNGAGRVMKILLDGEVLKAQLAGQPVFALFAHSPTAFSIPDHGAALEFVTGDGPSSAITLKQGGKILEFKRGPY